MWLIRAHKAHKAATLAAVALGSARRPTSSNPSEFSSQFVSLVAISIDGRLENDAVTHRRLLCRIAETFFSI